MGNIGTLALGALLIIGVLFIGYKMDTAPEKAPTKKAPKAPKTPKKPKTSKIKEEYVEEVSTVKDFVNDDMPYEDESEYLSTNFAEEDDDISLFGASEAVESTFNNDIDDSILFNTDVKEDLKEELKEDINEEDIIIPDPVVLPKDEEDDFSSTMIFDTEKLNNELEEIEKMDHVDEMVAMLGEFGKADSLPDEEPDDYTEPVYGIDEKLKALDEEEEPKPIIEGPIQPSANDAESFMNELKRMKESAEVQDFSGFEVDNKDKELKDIQKRYTKKKSEDEIVDIEMPKIPFTAEDHTTDNGVDENFLAQMEKNLKQTQKERLNKSKSTTKKSTKKKDE